MTYEYKCKNCGVFERTQRITDEPIKRCPTCKCKVVRLISSGNFRLKGGGWSSDGYSSYDKD